MLFPSLLVSGLSFPDLCDWFAQHAVKKSLFSQSDVKQTPIIIGHVIFPRFPLTLSRAYHPLFVFPRFLHVKPFPAFACRSHFPALATRYMLFLGVLIGSLRRFRL